MRNRVILVVLVLLTMWTAFWASNPNNAYAAQVRIRIAELFGQPGLFYTGDDGITPVAVASSTPLPVSASLNVASLSLTVTPMSTQNTATSPLNILATGAMMDSAGNVKVDIASSQITISGGPMAKGNTATDPINITRNDSPTGGATMPIMIVGSITNPVPIIASRTSGGVITDICNILVNLGLATNPVIVSPAAGTTIGISGSVTVNDGAASLSSIISGGALSVSAGISTFTSMVDANNRIRTANLATQTRIISALASAISASSSTGIPMGQIATPTEPMTIEFHVNIGNAYILPGLATTTAATIIASGSLYSAGTGVAYDYGSGFTFSITGCPSDTANSSSSITLHTRK